VRGEATAGEEAVGRAGAQENLLLCKVTFYTGLYCKVPAVIQHGVVSPGCAQENLLARPASTSPAQSEETGIPWVPEVQKEQSTRLKKGETL